MITSTFVRRMEGITDRLIGVKSAAGRTIHTMIDARDGPLTGSHTRNSFTTKGQETSALIAPLAPRENAATTSNLPFHSFGMQTKKVTLIRASSGRVVVISIECFQPGARVGGNISRTILTCPPTDETAFELNGTVLSSANPSSPVED